MLYYRYQEEREISYLNILFPGDSLTKFSRSENESGKEALASLTTRARLFHLKNKIKEQT